jgi:acylglycerol lipase
VRKMKYEETTYVGYDGLHMHMSAWMPDNDKPRALLICIHGLGSHGYTLKNIGEYFAERQYAVFAPDMRGFGHYAGRKGHVVSFDEYIEDMYNIVMQVKDRYLNKLTFLFGHSLGGQHVIRYVVAYPKGVDGMMLSCPGVSETLDISPVKRLAGQFLSLLNVKIYFENTLDFSLASHDPEVQKQHENDPLRFDKVTPRFGIEGLRAAKVAFKAAPYIMLPTLVQQAGNDKMVDPAKTKEFFDALGSKDKTWYLYDGLYHELHGELEKEKVLKDMDTWLEKRIMS